MLGGGVSDCSASWLGRVGSLAVDRRRGLCEGMCGDFWVEEFESIVFRLNLNCRQQFECLDSTTLEQFARRTIQFGAALPLLMLGEVMSASNDCFRKVFVCVTKNHLVLCW